MTSVAFEQPPITDPVAELAAIEAELAKRQQVTRLQRSIPNVFKPFSKPARNKGAYGGRGSAKSHTFARLVLLRCLTKPGTRVVCIREVQRSLGQSVKRLLEDTIQMYGLGQQFRVLAYQIETPGGGIIIFQGMQDHTAESIKSLEGFDIAWVEEAQALSARSLELLRPTLRKDNSELWFTWNPRFPTDPVDAFLRGPSGPPPRSIVVQANYTDNPYLPQVLRDELDWDMKRDVEKYSHIWLGEYERHSEARVFKNWRIEDFEAPVNTEFLFGGDWGFSVDPSVLVRSYVIERTLFIDYEAYKVGCEIDDTPALFDSIGCTKDHQHTPELINAEGHKPGSLANHCEGMARNWQIIADSARPETISYMIRHGYPRVVPAKKGPGSVEEGIQFLKNYDIVIHPRCTHTIDEFTHYSFKKHTLTGEIIPVLEDKKNHVIDSTRYMVEPLRNPGIGWITW